MNLLFDNRLAPLTSRIGFLEGDVELITQTFVRWQQPIQSGRGVSLSVRPVSAKLDALLCSLLPLTSVERRRFLFVSTRSPWVAYFDNGHKGADTFSCISFLAKQLNCRGLGIAAVPNTIAGESKNAKGRYGAVILEAYGGKATDFLNYVRSVSVANDGGKWVFSQAGAPFPFEDKSATRIQKLQSALLSRCWTVICDT